LVAYLLLGVAQIAGLVLIAFGLPGAWVQLVAVAAIGWWTGFTFIGVAPLLILVTLLASGELLALLVRRRRLGPIATRKIGFAALIGGVGGGILGVFFPLMGSMIGVLLGASTGALIGGVRARSDGVAMGDLWGPIAAVIARTTAGVAVAAFTLLLLIP
jgi:hypothetical protein